MLARHRTLPALTLALGLTLPVSNAHAAWPHDPQTNLQVSNSDASFPTGIVSDGAGGTFIAWSALGDVYVQHLTLAGVPSAGWPAGGLAICTAPGIQDSPVLCADEAGGVIVAWSDTRGGNRDIYAQRVTGAGAVPAGWPANGRQLSNDAHDEVAPSIATDANGGALLAWELIFSATDHDVFGAEVAASGAVVWSHGIAQPVAIQGGPVVVNAGNQSGFIVYDDNGGGSYDVRAVRTNPGGGIAWNVPLCNEPGDQMAPVATADGAGGAIVAWTDSRNGLPDVYGTRVTAAGTISPGWTVNGVAVCTAANSQQNPAIVPDGVQGAYVAWEDQRSGDGFDHVFAVRLLASGLPAPGWTPNGVAISAGTQEQGAPALAADGTGGVYVAWMDWSGGSTQSDVFAQRELSNGSVAPGWTAGGTPVSIAPLAQSLPLIAADDGGGAVITFRDTRVLGGAPVVFAQRMDRFGVAGNPEPSIVKVRDVLADQGGQVRVDWNASWLDADPYYAIGSYWIWREAPAAGATAALARGARLLDASLAAEISRARPGDMATLGAHGIYTTTTAGAAAIYWELVATQAASGFPTYSVVAPTTTDSTAAHNFHTPFMVQARAASGPAYWSSAPDSGYSVDNLPPATPAPFAGVYATGSTVLHWGANPEPDLARYRLYRGSNPGFVPAGGNLVADTADTTFTDAPGGPFYYKLAAVDAHGNASAYALAQPSGTVDAPRADALVLRLEPVRPNPMRSAATISFVLPARGAVTLDVFDASGRRVRTLLDGIAERGAQTVRWNGRDASGRAVTSGLYFVRFAAAGQVFNQRLIAIQ